MPTIFELFVENAERFENFPWKMMIFFHKMADYFQTMADYFATLGTPTQRMCSAAA